MRSRDGRWTDGRMGVASEHHGNSVSVGDLRLTVGERRLLRSKCACERTDIGFSLKELAEGSGATHTVWRLRCAVIFDDGVLVHLQLESRRKMRGCQ